MEIVNTIQNMKQKKTQKNKVMNETKKDKVNIQLDH